MKLFTAIVLAVLASAQTKPAGSTKVPAALNFTMNSIDGKPVDLSKYQGRVVLMVNVASECGFTPQYAGLEELHKKYAAKGLNILGFPANDFGAQEPGTNGEIAQFCKINYGVSFPLAKKSSVISTWPACNQNRFCVSRWKARSRKRKNCWSKTMSRQGQSSKLRLLPVRA